MTMAEKSVMAEELVSTSLSMGSAASSLCAKHKQTWLYTTLPFSGWLRMRFISYASVCKCIERLANSSCFSVVRGGWGFREGLGGRGGDCFGFRSFCRLVMFI